MSLGDGFTNIGGPKLQHHEGVGACDADLAGECGAVGTVSGNGARVGLLDGNRATGASAGVDTSLNIYANVVVALEFLRRHKFNTHSLLAVGNGLYELEISRFGNRSITELGKGICKRQRLVAKRQDV